VICALCFGLRHSQQVWTGREAGMPLGTPRSQTVGHSGWDESRPDKEVISHWSLIIFNLHFRFTACN